MFQVTGPNNPGHNHQQGPLDQSYIGANRNSPAYPMNNSMTVHNPNEASATSYINQLTATPAMQSQGGIPSPMLGFTPIQSTLNQDKIMGMMTQAPPMPNPSTPYSHNTTQQGPFASMTQQLMTPNATGHQQTPQNTQQLQHHYAQQMLNAARLSDDTTVKPSSYSATQQANSFRGYPNQTNGSMGQMIPPPLPPPDTTPPNPNTRKESSPPMTQITHSQQMDQANTAPTQQVSSIVPASTPTNNSDTNDLGPLSVDEVKLIKHFRSIVKDLPQKWQSGPGHYDTTPVYGLQLPTHVQPPEQVDSRRIDITGLNVLFVPLSSWLMWDRENWALRYLCQNKWQSLELTRSLDEKNAVNALLRAMRTQGGKALHIPRLLHYHSGASQAPRTTEAKKSAWDKIATRVVEGWRKDCDPNILAAETEGQAEEQKLRKQVMEATAILEQQAIQISHMREVNQQNRVASTQDKTHNTAGQRTDIPCVTAPMNQPNGYQRQVVCNATPVAVPHRAIKTHQVQANMSQQTPKNTIAQQQCPITIQQSYQTHRNTGESHHMQQSNQVQTHQMMNSAHQRRYDGMGKPMDREEHHMSQQNSRVQEFQQTNHNATPASAQRANSWQPFPKNHQRPQNMAYAQHHYGDNTTPHPSKHDEDHNKRQKLTYPTDGTTENYKMQDANAEKRSETRSSEKEQKQHREYAQTEMVDHYAQDPKPNSTFGSSASSSGIGNPHNQGKTHDKQIPTVQIEDSESEEEDIRRYIQQLRADKQQKREKTIKRSTAEPSKRTKTPRNKEKETAVSDSSGDQDTPEANNTERIPSTKITKHLKKGISTNDETQKKKKLQREKEGKDDDQKKKQKKIEEMKLLAAQIMSEEDKEDTSNNNMSSTSSNAEEDDVANRSRKPSSKKRTCCTQKHEIQ